MNKLAKLISLLLAFCMCLSLCSFGALAAEGDFTVVLSDGADGTRDVRGWA